MHVSSVKDGSIIRFLSDKDILRDYMKVCGSDGLGGVVNLSSGLYIPIHDIDEFSREVYIIANDIKEYFELSIG